MSNAQSYCDIIETLSLVCVYNSQLLPLILFIIDTISHIYISIQTCYLQEAVTPSNNNNNDNNNKLVLHDVGHRHTGERGDRRCQNLAN